MVPRTLRPVDPLSWTSGLPRLRPQCGELMVIISSKAAMRREPPPYSKGNRPRLPERTGSPGLSRSLHAPETPIARPILALLPGAGNVDGGKAFRARRSGGAPLRPRGILSGVGRCEHGGGRRSQFLPLAKIPHCFSWGGASAEAGVLSGPEEPRAARGGGGRPYRREAASGGSGPGQGTDEIDDLIQVAPRPEYPLDAHPLELLGVGGRDDASHDKG